MDPRIVDGLFGASGIVTGALFLLDQPALAMMSNVVLILGACVCSLADPEAPHRTSGAARASGPRD